MKHPSGRPIAPRLKFEYKYSWFRRFTFKERCLIFIGYNLQVHNHWLTAHSAGHTQPVIKGVVTKELSATDQFLADNMEAIKDISCKQS